MSYKLYNFALNLHTSRKPITKENKTKVLRPQDRWLKEFDNKESVYINSFDSLKLYSYKVINGEASKWAILVHGYLSNYKEMSSCAYNYYNEGYNLIIPSLRGHGQSEGNYVGMGWHDRLDIISWIEYVLKQDKEAKILMHGISMGAATVMMASGENLHPNVKVIVEDCGYTSAKEQLAYKLKDIFGLPSFPLLNLCSLISKVKSNYFLEEASSINQIKKSKTPTLFIHGRKDNFVPFYMLDELYEACNAPKHKVIIENSRHAENEQVNSELYWIEVNKFISKYI